MFIVLQGFAYSGKSTLGSMVAKELQLDDKDFKELFYDAYGMTENEFLVQKGTIEFKNAEKLILQDIVNNKYNNFVISLSGSSVYNNEEMERITKIAKVVYLNVSFDIIQKRKELDPKKDVRPILYPDGITNFPELYNQRVELYKKYAAITITVRDGDTPENTTQMIMKEILSDCGTI